MRFLDSAFHVPTYRVPPVHVKDKISVLRFCGFASVKDLTRVGGIFTKFDKKCSCARGIVYAYDTTRPTKPTGWVSGGGHATLNHEVLHNRLWYTVVVGKACRAY